MGGTLSAMTDVDQALICEGLDRLGVTEVRVLKPRAQKQVPRRPRWRTTRTEVIQIGSSAPEALRRAEREVELLVSLDSNYVVKVASDRSSSTTQSSRLGETRPSRPPPNCRSHEPHRHSAIIAAEERDS